MALEPNIDVAERMKVIAERMGRGQDTYAGRLDGWHKLGEVSGQFQTWREMLAAAKADFHVFKSQLHDGLGRPVSAWGTFRWNIADKAAGNTQAAKFLGAVGQDYTIIQHTSGFELLDELVGRIDGAHYETMGTLDYGRVVWGQVDPNVQIRVGDDVSDVLLSFHTSHDGSKAFDIYESLLRHVCKNTLRAGSLRRLAASLRVRHTKNAKDRITDLKAEISEIRDSAMTMQDRLTFLSKRRVTKESLSAIMERLFPQTKNDDGVQTSSTRRDNILADVLALYESNDGNAFPEFRGTAYNLLNAVTEYTDHVRSSSAAGNGKARAESAIFGSGAKLKSDALHTILEATKDMPEVLMRGNGSGVGSDIVGSMLLARS